MEFRAQENEMRTSSGPLSYTHLSKEGGERRSRSVSSSHHHNGSTTTTTNINCTTQTLDNNYPPRPNFQHHHHQTLHLSRDPDPVDRVTTTTVLGTTTFSPGASVVKSSSKTTSSSTVRYRECLKNHAASSGGNVFDGCGEFMPSGEEGSLEALKCAACQCHRNFHRKEIDGESHQLYSPSSRRSSSANTPTLMLNPLQLPPPLPSPSSLHHHHHHHHPHHKYFNHGPPIIQPMNVAYGGGGGTESSSEDLNVYGSTEAMAAVPQPPFTLSKKRFRTKFTQEQKDKMLEFAEKVGWRFQKQDEEEVERFCTEIGIKRQVLKVWMHNNKSTMKNKQQPENINMVINDMSSTDIHQSIDETSHDHDEPVQEGGLDT